MDATYFKQRNKDNTLRLRELLTELPDFCDEYFTGIETTTTCLTRLNYAYDLRVFFHYLTSEVSRFEGISPTEFSMRDLRRVTTTDIEKFISYLSLYTFCGKEYSNDNTGKSRKLSAVRAMFKYFYNKEKLDSDPAAKVSMPKLKEKAIVRLDVNEVVELLDSVEDGSGLTARQKSFHQKTKLRDVAMLTLFWAPVFVYRNASGLTFPTSILKTRLSPSPEKAESKPCSISATKFRKRWRLISRSVFRTKTTPITSLLSFCRCKRSAFQRGPLRIWSKNTAV